MTDAEREPTSPEVPHEIPGLRLMAIVRWALLVAVALLAAGTWWTYVLHGADEVQGEDRYYCPMHPQIRSPQPGECPICHMRLEPIPADEAAVGEAHEHDHDHGDEAAPADTEPVAVMLTTERRQTSGIATAPARRESVSDGARWPAVVEAREGARAEVRVRTSAYVERLVVREPGVVVRPGQVLAWIYSPEIVRAAEELRSARAWPPIPGSEASAAPHTLDDAARERLVLLGVAPGDIERLLEGERAPRTVPLRAPVAGHVTRLETAVGAYATPDALLFEIVDLSRVRAVASVFADELTLAGPGAAALFEPRDGGEAIALELELIEPDVGGDARTARVRFIARNPTLALRPGQIGDVVLEGTATEHLVVPRDAVIDTGLRRYVFVARAGGLFEPRAVELGPLRGEQRVIARGLEPGELVVVRGGFVLDSESRLQSALAPAPVQPEAGHSEPSHEAPR